MAFLFTSMWPPHHAVDALRHRAVLAFEMVKRNAGIDVTLVVLVGHAIHVGEEQFEVTAQPLDRVVDECFLPREFFERRIEVAFGELLHAGHGFLLHVNMAGNHVVDRLSQGPILALELLHRDRGVDVALIVLASHSPDLLEKEFHLGRQCCTPRPCLRHLSRSGPVGRRFSAQLCCHT
jgi:hypothetical protein